MIVSSLVFLTLALCQQVPAPPIAELLRARLEQLHDARATPVHGVTLKRPDAVVHFFEARGFEPAWAIPSASDQIRRAIREIENDGLTPATYHLAAIERLLESRALAPAVALDVDLQLLLTDAVAALIDDARYGKVRPVMLDPRWNIDPRENAPPLETSVADVAHARSPFAAIEGLKPNHFIYVGLKRALVDLRAKATAGGWITMTQGPTLKPGAADRRIPAIRQRLAATGELSADATNDSDVYDGRLVAAVKRFQERHRLTPDAAIGRTTIVAMNVSAEMRVRQVRANLERARWVLGGLSDSFVLVNLPAFKIYVIRNGKNVWETRAQIGREARQTPAFRADMRYLVFNPDWTVPPTILAKDVLAGMRKGENPIARKHLTILDGNNRQIDPTTIDWASATPASFRYTLRQPPGPDNALGRVKFIFPNEHSIFLHDTPSRELFAADQRTFSSGCIRVERPLELAGVLLEGQKDWNQDRIQQIVDSGESRTVRLDTPLPVLIVYWTVSVGAGGELHYARDVYNLDAAVMRKLD
jgi:murein L,D-transpeptidase YcbB/YkuD